MYTIVIFFIYFFILILDSLLCQSSYFAKVMEAFLSTEEQNQKVENVGD